MCFHGNNIDEYGVAEGPAEALSNFTACFWAKAMPHNLPITSILSYAYTEGTTVESDGLLVHVTEKLELKIEFTISAGLNVKPIRYSSRIMTLVFIISKGYIPRTRLICHLSTPRRAAPRVDKNISTEVRGI